MNAHRHPTRTGVTICPICEGQGTVPNSTTCWHPNDPDCWPVECTNCDGVGHFACEACGFDTAVSGYDCWACESAADLPAGIDADEAANAIRVAIGAPVEARRAA